MEKVTAEHDIFPGSTDNFDHNEQLLLKMHCPCPNCGCGLNDRQFNLDSIESEAPTTTALRIEALLTSNEPPLESERHSLSNVFLQNQTDLSDMDSQISRLRDALQSLETQQACTAATISKCKAVLSPIRSLPDDVLCEIFISCINEDMAYYNTTAAKSSQLSLSQDTKKNPGFSPTSPENGDGWLWPFRAFGPILESCLGLTATRTI
ncbi:hypothetical protein C8J56DRAFT_1046916 [Mycena floridula]|nr:hypothetical protein C8J56DRAFT_1046916 [Mycena floridula]